MIQKKGDYDNYWKWMKNQSPGEFGSVPFITLEIHRINALEGSEYEDMFGTNVGTFHRWTEKGSEKHFDKGDLDVLYHNFRKKLDSNPNVITEWWNETNKRGEELIDSSKKLSTDLEKLTNEQLKDRFLDTADQYWNLGVMSSLPLFGGKALEEILNPHMTETLETAGESPEKKTEYTTILTKGDYYSIPDKENDILRSLAQDVKKSGATAYDLPSHLETRLQEHAKKWEFLPYKWTGPTWDVEDFRERLDNILNEKESNSKQENDMPEITREEIIKNLGIDEKHQNYYTALGRLISMKEMKGNYMSIAAYHLESFRNEIENRFGLTQHEIAFMLTEDFDKLLTTGKIDRDELKKRTQDFVWRASNGQEEFFSGKDAEAEYQKEFHWIEVAKDQKAFDGFSTYQGKVVGIARKVIDYTNDAEHFQPGDVLIAPRTTLHYEPLMADALAVLTVESGSTQHAALITRNMKIPGIVGLEGIIEGIEDGQPVLVDADIGRVTKLTQTEYESLLEKSIDGVLSYEEKSKPTIEVGEDNSKIIQLNKEEIKKYGNRGIIEYEQVSKIYDTMELGIKAGNQALKSKKFNVPNGFILPTSFFYDYITQAGLKDDIENLAVELNGKKNNIQTISPYSRKLISKIMNARVDGFFDDVIDRYNLLDRNFVIARSSSIYEDMDDNPFSGIYESESGLKGKKALIEGIKKVWASMYSTHAIHYSIKNGYNPTTNQMAVLMQEMINPDVSGTLFTHVDGYHLIESVEGLCDPLVSNKVTPAAYWIDSNKDVAFLKPGRQKFAEYISDGQILRRHANVTDPLDRGTTYELAHCAEQLSKQFSGPYDYEWAKEDGILYMTQARKLVETPNLPRELTSNNLPPIEIRK